MGFPTLLACSVLSPINLSGGLTFAHFCFSASGRKLEKSVVLILTDLRSHFHSREKTILGLFLSLILIDEEKSGFPIRK